MAASADDEIVVSDGTLTRRARVYRWFLDHLATFPGRVTALTFAAGVLVTVVVVAADGDRDLTSIVSLIATLWALFFAVVIYLLTARDTDKVLVQIADLHEQLATALTAPDEEGAREPAPETPSPPEVGRERPRAAEAHHVPRLVTGSSEIAEAVPRELLDSWATATGVQPAELTRAWTRDSRSDRQWVLEASGNRRWVVFSRGGRGVGVLPLHASGQGRRSR